MTDPNLSPDDGVWSYRIAALCQEGQSWSVLNTQGKVSAFCGPSPTRDDDPGQDAVGVATHPSGATVLAVADGVGGSPLGAEASRLALTVLFRQLQAAQPEASALRAAVLDSFDAANAQVKGLGVRAATTLVVATVIGHDFRCFFVGDSEVWVVGQRSKIEYRSVAHSPVGYAVEAGYMDEREAIMHKDRHLLSNMLGADEMSVQVGPALRLKRYDTVLLSSDGPLDNLFPQEIVTTVRKGPIDGCRDSLVRASLRRMASDESSVRPSKPDDIGIALYRPVG